MLGIRLQNFGYLRKKICTAKAVSAWVFSTTMLRITGSIPNQAFVDIFGQRISSGLSYLYKMIIGRESFELITVEVLIKY